MSMRQRPSSLGTPVEDQHVPFTKFTQRITARLQVDRMKRIDLRLPFIRMQDKLWAHNAELIEAKSMGICGMRKDEGWRIPVEWTLRLA